MDLTNQIKACLENQATDRTIEARDQHTDQRRTEVVDRCVGLTNRDADPRLEPDSHSTHRRFTVRKDIVYPELSWEIVGAAIEVHRHLGPGQLESIYQRAMERELQRRAISLCTQVPVPMYFKGEHVGDFYADMIVEDLVILELKAVEHWKAVHTAQLVSYLHAADLRLGMLMNFNVLRMVNGIRRVVR